MKELATITISEEFKADRVYTVDARKLQLSGTWLFRESCEGRDYFTDTAGRQIEIRYSK